MPELSNALIVGALFVNGVIGALIGKFAGKVGLGAILGAFLGPIGWIIVLLLPRDAMESPTTLDRFENDKMPNDAKISFEDYKRNQKHTRPGFSHLHQIEQRREWREHLEQAAKTNASDHSSKPNSTSVSPVNDQSVSVEDRLKQLKELEEKGLISNAEATSKRSQIIESI